MKREAYIFFSDIVGYSKLVSKNENHALNLLSEHDIILKKYILQKKGKIIKHIGDAIFAEFNNSEDLVNASILIQKNIKKRNDIYPIDDQFQIRIGLHKGEVVEKDGDLFGNEVNICSRIETIAFSGSIACSEKIYKDNIDLNFRCYGYVGLKNINKPIKIFKLYNDYDHYYSENDDDFVNSLKQICINILSSDEVVKSIIPIAFLYPKNIGEQNQDFFCYEFLKQTIEYSNKIDQIRTPNFNTIIESKNKSIGDISHELSIEYIVQSSILCIDEIFKINISLFSINSGVNIYEKSFSSNINEIKTVIGFILIDITSLLDIEINKEITSLFKQKNKINSKAYSLYLEGKNLSDNISQSDSLIKSKNILLESIDLEKSFSEAYAALGMTYSLLGENDEAEEYLESGVELAEEHENIESLSLLYNYLGIYYRKLLNIKKSIKFFEKSLILQKKMNDRLMQANIYNNMSTCYTIKGNNEEALNLIFRAEDIYKTMNEEKKLANSYGNIGNIFANMDDYKNSIKYYDLAKSIFNLEEMYASYSQILILQAELYLNLDELSKAKVNLDESNNILSSFNIPSHQAYRYYLVAKILFKEQDFDEALDYIEDAIEIFEELNNKLKIGDLLVLNAEIMIKLNKIKKAQRSLDKAEKICEKHNDKPLKDYLNKVKQKII